MTFFIALVLIVLPGAAQEPETPVFRGGVTLVRVDAQVTERGRAVDGLKAEDFEVHDEGAPRKILYFGHETQPLDLVLLLDVSGSMYRSLQELSAAARSALAALHEGDRVAVMLFARETALREPFTTDFAAVERRIREATTERGLGSGTAIYAAIVKAAGYLAGEQRPQARRAVLIVTDNLSLNYQVTDEDVLRALSAADAVLNGILIGRQRRPDPPEPGRALNPDFTPSDVFKLAGDTGGETAEARRAGESFQQMIERIRARYGLQYEAPTALPGAYRRIRVELSAAARRRHPHAEVRARAGYYAAR
jgi:VWFA-related protein